MKTSRILIVEDDESIRELYRDVLEGEGYEVETCANGLEALLSLKGQEEPCLILLDMMMPIMNGREFMLEFEKREHTVIPVPVYLVSATAGRAEGQKMGCRGYLKKPFSVEALLTIVRSHCDLTGCKSIAKPPETITRVPYLKKLQAGEPLSAAP